jgi:hypothetical protein
LNKTFGKNMNHWKKISKKIIENIYNIIKKIQYIVNY